MYMLLHACSVIVSTGALTLKSNLDFHCYCRQLDFPRTSSAADNGSVVASEQVQAACMCHLALSYHILHANLLTDDAGCLQHAYRLSVTIQHLNDLLNTDQADVPVLSLLW